MKHLIIYAHPNENSLNHHLLQAVVGSLQNREHEIEIRDLYQLNFKPVLSLEDMTGQRTGKVSDDVKQEQNYINWADHITFIYPIWWTGMPAIIKGFIDRVFSYGFAYRYDQGVQKVCFPVNKPLLSIHMANRKPNTRRLGWTRLFC